MAWEFESPPGHQLNMRAAEFLRLFRLNVVLHRGFLRVLRWPGSVPMAAVVSAKRFSFFFERQTGFWWAVFCSVLSSAADAFPSCLTCGSGRRASFFSVGIHCAADCCAALPYAFRPVPAAVDGKEPPGVSYARFVFAHGGGRLPCAAGEKHSLKERI